MLNPESRYMWEPKLFRLLKAMATHDAHRRDSSAAAQRVAPTGVGEHGTYTRVDQEPGMVSRRSVEGRNDVAKGTERVGCREVGARRSSDEVGELAPGDPAERRSAPRNSHVGAKR